MSTNAMQQQQWRVLGECEGELLEGGVRCVGLKPVCECFAYSFIILQQLVS